MIPGVLSVFRFCSAQTDLRTGHRYLSDPVPFVFVELDDIIEHVVTEGDTWETIAARYYRSLENGALLWRVVAEFQPRRPMDATIPPEKGSIVYVPSARVVLESIFSEARRADYEA